MVLPLSKTERLKPNSKMTNQGKRRLNVIQEETSEQTSNSQQEDEEDQDES